MLLIINNYTHRTFASVKMNSRKHIQRKSTFTSTTSRQADNHRDAKSPPGRISSMKNMSFDEIPFSQHIFQLCEAKSVKMTPFDVCGSQKLFPSQKTDKKLKNLFMDNLDSKQAKNPFLQACRENVSRNIQKPSVKMTRQSLQTCEDLQDSNITTFRVIKKKSLNAYQDENVDVIL